MSNKNPVKAFEMYLIRHGETSGNAGTPCGENEDARDPGLNERGKRQAALAGKRFSALALDEIFASGLERAVETAAHIARNQPENGCQTVSILPILCETGVDEDYEGHTLAYYSGKYPVKKAEGVTGDKLVVPPIPPTTPPYLPGAKRLSVTSPGAL
jgi:broad specificity phosphatase PhoE